MTRLGRVDAQAYYNYLPNLHHECGDVWRGMPTFGLLDVPTCSGVVITPACDLSWSKSDTLTYLPIISIRSYFALDAALPIVLERIEKSLLHLNGIDEPDWDKGNYVSPNIEMIQSLEKKITDYLASGQKSQKIIDESAKILSGLRVISCINDRNVNEVPAIDISTCLGSEWRKIKEKIITNSFSPALHFLPNDNQVLELSGILKNSVVLFRYPLTIPLRVLAVSQEVSDANWPDLLDRLGLSAAMKSAFISARPVKMLSLKSAFLADLLTRFSALYNRIGSPDFSIETVRRYSEEVDL